MIDNERIERFINNFVGYNQSWKQIPHSQITDIAIQWCENADDSIKYIRDNEDILKRAWLMYRIFKERDTHVVYFIQNVDTNLIKIGCTRNIFQRIKELKQSAALSGFSYARYKCIGAIYSPLKIKGVLNCHRLENELHHKFESQRKYSEWFAISQQEVKNIISEYAPLKYKNFSIGIHICNYCLPTIIDCNENLFMKCIANQIWQETDLCRHNSYGYTIIELIDTIKPYINKDMIDVMTELIYPQFDKLEST